MGHIIMGSVIMVISYQEISYEHRNSLRFSKFPVIFPVLREFWTAGLRRIGGESAGAAIREITASCRCFTFAGLAMSSKDSLNAAAVLSRRTGYRRARPGRKGGGTSPGGRRRKPGAGSPAQEARQCG